MTIIINNVYAFQYPTKNRCTILVQPSFAKLVLLPIREAYEWKHVGCGAGTGGSSTCFQFVKRMNGNTTKAITNARSEFSCVQFVKRMNGNERNLDNLSDISFSCFQFVKRMNGNKIEPVLGLL